MNRASAIVYHIKLINNTHVYMNAWVNIWSMFNNGVKSPR